jgi:hypothetical protein
MWNLQRIRERAISSLEDHDMDLLDKVVLAHKYGIKEWYLRTYIALVTRPASLTYEEGEKLGFDFALKIAKVREERYSKSWVCVKTTKGNDSGFSVHRNEPLSGSSLEGIIVRTFNI